MATEDDNFDIDIYGDGSGYNTNEQGDQNQDDTELVLDAPETAPPAPSSDANKANNASNASNANSTSNANHATNNVPAESNRPVESVSTSNGDHAMTTQQTPAQEAPMPPHGVKRKDYDDRPSDPDATSALLVSDLFWWETDDDIRGWIAAAGSENELKDVTFSEHKVNGKSKGQAFVEFSTPQAATASKHKIESGAAPGQSGRKHLVNYTNPHQNPFRTLPKDAPMRKDAANRNMGGNFNPGTNQNNNFGGGMNMGGGGGYRGGRGGFNNRGMGGNNFNNRNNFNNMGGFQGGGAGGPGMMGGFQGGPMGGMQNYGFNNRGGMMGGGMRGGPGGMRGRGGGNMGGNNMMGMPGMNPMAGGMGMNPMAGGMNPMMNMGMQGQGFQGPNPAAFNQGFFNNQGGAGAGGNDASWNPHGAKRSRQE